jgi:hypothetical protein
MTAIEVITPDLSWLHSIHRPETMLGDHFVEHPFQIIEDDVCLAGKPAFRIDAPYGVAIDNVVAVAARGTLAGLVANLPPPEVTDWAIRTFLATEGLVGFEIMTLDALARFADLPPPTLKRCPRCRGKLREPGTEVLMGVHATLVDRTTGATLRECPSQMVCTLCDGQGRIPYLDDGFAQKGPVKIDRRALTRIVPHLRGSEVAFCTAPSLDGLGMDIHVRPYVEQNGQKTVGGEWRIVLSQVPESPKETEAAFAAPASA